MGNITDLEKEKFEIKEGKVSMRNISVSYGGEISTDISLNDLEFQKFDSTGRIRTLLSF